MARRWTELDEVEDRIARGISRGSGFDYSVSLHTAPAPEPAPAPLAAPVMPPAVVFSSIPVWTDWVGGTLFTIILVNGKRQTFQLYAVDLDTWVMVGLFGLFVDALFDVQQWRIFFAEGKTLADWRKANPDGVEPLLRGQ